MLLGFRIQQMNRLISPSRNHFFSPPFGKLMGLSDWYFPSRCLSSPASPLSRCILDYCLLVADCGCVLVPFLSVVPFFFFPTPHVSNYRGIRLRFSTMFLVFLHGVHAGLRDVRLFARTCLFDAVFPLGLGWMPSSIYLILSPCGCPVSLLVFF